MTSADEQAFLTAILAAPEDDTPRLVYADWLDERGQGDDQARAALIRKQCQAERLPLGSKDRKKLEREANAILKKHGDGWAKGLKDLKVVDQWSFRRGFLDGITMSATKFTQNAQKVFDAAPTIRSAQFPDASNEVGRLAQCEYLSRLAAVNIKEMCRCGFCPIHNDLRALFTSKHTRSLTDLNISGDRMDAEGAKGLAESAALAHLTHLDVSRNPLGREGIAALGKSEHLKNLVSLDLSMTRLNAAAIEDLGKLKNFPALRQLTLQQNRISTATLKAFVVSPLFAQLTSLDLSLNPFGKSGAKVLAAVPKSAKLERLVVWNCRISEEGNTLLKERFGKGVVCDPGS